MKGFAVIHFILFLLLMLVYQLVGAQDYVLTARGDSIAGEVKPLLYGPEKKVQVTGSGKEKATFSLFEVRAFSDEGETFHPVKGEKGYVFMKLVQPGYLTLYAYQPENQTRFDGLFLQKLDGDNMVVPNLGFKKYMSQFLEDCPAVAEQIKSGVLNRKNLETLVTSYNACIDARSIDHEEVIAKQEEQAIRISAWESLEQKVREADFNDKDDALEMIAEIRKKIRQQEKIPNFLVEGLKNSLRNTHLTTSLEKALEETDQP